MANINEILARAAALRQETALNSIDPERAGGIMYDTLLALNELWLQQGAALVISKIYASVAAMNADTSPVSDLTGKPIRPGMVVVIASSDSDNGSVYRYNGTSSPRWSLVGKIGNITPEDSLTSDSTQLPLAAHQGKVLDGKISQLGQEINGLVSNNYTEGYYIDSSGVLAEGSAWGASDFIEYESGNDVIWTFGGGQFGSACIVFYDSSKTPFENGYWGAPNGGSKTISASDIARYAPNAAYLRASFRLAYIEEANVKVADEVVWEPENIQIDGLVKECVKGWILSEAYTVSSLTRDSDGNVSTANVVWPDMKTGTLTITRNSEGNATSISATHDAVTYTLTITRNSEGDVTTTSISVS